MLKIKKHVNRVLFLLLFSGLVSFSTYAGPPYVTDDPEPVEYEHWEFYLASQSLHEPSSWLVTAPQIEINYGAIPNVQLHVILPFAVLSQTGNPVQYGYSDTELGVKYRFVQETENRPQIGTFILVEVPTGNNSKGLGNGHTQTFIPVWMQKSFGAWTTYGGGGYWFNPGPGNRDWGFIGWLIQRSFRHDTTLGLELFHFTPRQPGGGSETRFNFGGIIDFNETHHFLFSLGRAIQGVNLFQSYLAYQLTF
ncbi:MAG: hypothetical protein WCQ53_07960 [bacterium]